MSHPKIIYAALSASAFFAGWYLSSYGPLIPILSRDTGLDETHYSYIMLTRMIGSMLGTYLAKALPDHLSTKTLVVGAALTTAITFYCITLSLSDLNIAACYTVASICSGLGNAIAFSVTFQLFPDDPAFYSQLRGLIHGLGTIVGPIMVGWLEVSNYLLLSLFQLIPVMALAYFPIPNIITKKQAQSYSKPIISFPSEALICALFFCYCVTENGLASWLPTYAVKSGVSDPQGSNFYSSLFWIPTTIARFLWIYVPGRVITRLHWIFRILIITTTFSLILQFLGQYQLVCIISPIATSLIVASVFTLGLALPADEGFQPTPSNTAHFMLSYTVAEGTFNGPLGYSMEFLTFRVLIFAQVMFAVVGSVLLRRIQGRLEEDKQNKQSQLLGERQLQSIK